MTRKLSLLLAASLLILSSCDPLRVYEENKEIEGGIWKAADKKVFEFQMEDTVSPFNVFINVRHRGDYPYSNLYLFITTHRPDGKMSVDTVECMLQGNEGKWLGDGIGDLYHNRLFFRSGVRFPVKGIYSFTFEQAMRTDELPHITDIGMRVEKIP